ncbi:vacuolar ATPase assembly integral membrane protein VMA21 [Aspergillus campestris IBT 28561]|uniref:Vacuolar ATPase assembly integral membrane protein VMA21 n=1 Tax=Aspergillus campestris (strain IBT 28561) TaxID=1392248 RepID=A0A2I1DDQ9_ASPC2|nr:vacuolar ATPase assembly integral membrane protein VMA21 [Aspergillus campestris IBT 28561]PKY08022.1 vacuolar ATPase assembly integral membrane protein VMA21 [Aspergillus campestris IBT 28561]
MAINRPQSQSPVDPSTSMETKPSASDVSPVVPKHVIYKLLGFTAAMITTPIGMYFVTVDFGGSATVGGITAAITANVVLFTYIWVAWQDDKEEREALAGKNEKKAQ